MNDELRLVEDAQSFAERLTQLVHGTVGPDCPPFVVTALEKSDVAYIRQSPETGIPLRLVEDNWVTVSATYRCRLGSSGYLRVRSSKFAVTFGSERAGQPMFRYDYDAELKKRSPRAHLQIGDSGNLAALSSLAGDGSKTARQRLGRVERGKAEFGPDDLHFPLGGERFRPALEDILQFLIDQLGVTAEPGWREVVEAARVDWRGRQLWAAVTDDPEMAVASLEHLGFRVEPPADVPPRRLEHLQAL